jgi:hypothetical protein
VSGGLPAVTVGKSQSTIAPSLSDVVAANHRDTVSNMDLYGISVWLICGGRAIMGCSVRLGGFSSIVVYLLSHRG